MRKISHNIIPGYLEISDLHEIMINFVNKLNQQNTILFHYTTSGRRKKLKKELEIACFRITQEFISNSIQHSGATEIEITLEYSKGLLMLKLFDNGIGLKTSEKSILAGKGMVTTLSRVKAFGGTLHYLTKKEITFGTMLHISFPV